MLYNIYFYIITSVILFHRYDSLNPTSLKKYKTFEYKVPIKALDIIKPIIMISASLSISSLLNPQCANAQIPSMEEFYQTSGTKIRDNQSPKVKIIKSIEGNDLKETILLCSKEISRLRDFVRDQNWNYVLESEEKLKKLYQPYFGVDLKGLAIELGVSREAAESIENLREELVYSLGELNEYALSHRIIIFNTEDLKMINTGSIGDGKTTLATSEELENIKSLTESIYKTTLEILKMVES